MTKRTYGTTQAKTGDYVRGRVYGPLARRMGLKDGTEIFAKLEANIYAKTETGWTLNFVETFAMGENVGSNYNVATYDQFALTYVYDDDGWEDQ